VSLELAHTPGLRRRVGQLLAQYHYRGFNGAVGENIQYLAGMSGAGVGGDGLWRGGLESRRAGSVHRLVGPAAPAALGRPGQPTALSDPALVRVTHLASHLLARATRRLSADWQARYGHPVWLVETFVEQDRFAGTAYQAAGWLPLGLTTGGPARIASEPCTAPANRLGATAPPPFSATSDDPMNLLTYLLAATARWGFVFPQERTSNEPSRWPLHSVRRGPTHAHPRHQFSRQHPEGLVG